MENKRTEWGDSMEHTNLRAREIISSGRPLTKYQLVSRTKVLVAGGYRARRETRKKCEKSAETRLQLTEFILESYIQHSRIRFSSLDDATHLQHFYYSLSRYDKNNLFKCNGKTLGTCT